ALAAPLLKLVEAAGDVASFQSTFVDAPTWIEVYNSFPKDLGSPGGGGASTTSRLLSADALTNDTERLAHVLEVLGPRPGGPVGGVSNPSLSGTMTLGSVAVDNALNPVWRDAVVHLTTSVSWDDTLNYAAVEAAIDDTTNVKGALLREIAPKGGVYLNEADRNEPKWQEAFWGTNYERLLAVKNKYDPDTMLWCQRCAGSEGWFQDLDGTLCKL
ncbi:hypothetical protein F5X68DRAFT_240458, partial [Plectosphaerella plurivora]